MRVFPIYANNGPRPLGCAASLTLNTSEKLQLSNRLHNLYNTYNVRSVAPSPLPSHTQRERLFSTDQIEPRVQFFIAPRHSPTNT